MEFIVKQEVNKLKYLFIARKSNKGTRLYLGFVKKGHLITTPFILFIDYRYR